MTQQRKKRAGKRGKKISLREFRAWLQGVEELQPEDWHPDHEQWKKIRNKIDNIVEEEPETQVVHHAYNNHSENGRGPVQMDGGAAAPPWAVPSPSVPVEPTGPPIGNSQLEEAQAFAPTKQPAPSIENSGAIPAINSPGGGEAPSSGQRIKTPDIDTSSGDYGSSFE